MTAYEKAVIKAFLNEAFGQMAAEVDGQTIIPGYFDTDSSYPENLYEERFVTRKVSTYGRNRGHIADLILKGVKSAGYFAVCLRGDNQAQMDAYKGFVDEIMSALDIVFQEE